MNWWLVRVVVVVLSFVVGSCLIAASQPSWTVIVGEFLVFYGGMAMGFVMGQHHGREQEEQRQMLGGVR